MLKSRVTKHEIALCWPENIHFSTKIFYLINSAENQQYALQINVS